jgi:two-component system, chemotaxis family, sensor kinase Cph1
VLLAVLSTGTGSLVVASAGHLPALLLGARAVSELAVTPGPPLGVARAHCKEEVAHLGDDCLLMFTDGLVERRRRSLADGLSLLSQVASSARALEPEAVADHVLAGMLPKGTGADDVALLTVRRRPRGTQKSGKA